MKAQIHGLLKVDPDTLSEDDFHKYWARTAYYLEHIEMVKFS